MTILTALIGISGLIIINSFPSPIEEDAVVDSYEATFHINGTLVENYTYLIKKSNKYSMLYRVWDAPLSMNKIDKPSIQYISRSNISFSDLVFYLKDYQGMTWVEDQRERAYVIEIEREIHTKAYDNEIGFYKPGNYQAGKYHVSYTFKIRPPIEYDNDVCHLNLKLANEHITYKKVKITIEGSDHIIKIYPHPPSLSVTRQENKIILQGSIEKNKLLEIEMLLDKDILGILDGFPTEYNDVSQNTIRVNNLYLFEYYLALGLLQLTRILAISSPLIFILLYVRFGREKQFVVPKYLSFVPNNKIKPWVVNLIFKSDALDFDENGFYATLLDLHKRKKISMKTKDKGLTIQILNKEGLDGYEQRVLGFLEDISENGIIDTDEIKKFANKLASNLKYESDLLRLQKNLLYITKKADTSIASKYIVYGRLKPVPLAIVSIILLLVSLSLVFLLSDFSSILIESTVTSIIPIAQSVVAIASPSTLFGKWKGSAYGEKLEWDSFKRLLSDLALMKKYAPEDLSMWGEWLVYGTSLGVGDKVAKAMGDLKIPLEEAKFVPVLPLFIRPIVTATPPSRTGGGRSAGGFGGGGFGAGGGFGGGGAGAR